MAEDLNKRIVELEKENQVLKKKLMRSEKNRARLEDIKEQSEYMLNTIIQELEEAQLTITESSQVLQSRNQALQHEIAERKRAEVKLKKLNQAMAFARDQALDANQAKSHFLAKMSHELRTPLNAIIGYCDLILGYEAYEMTEFADEIRTDLNNVLRSSRYLLTLINDLLDISKIEAGKIDAFPEEFELLKMLDEIRLVMDPMFQTNQNKFTLDYQSSISTLYTDRRMLQQVLHNLLSNASKFSRGGAISLTITDDNHESTWVKDVGPGRFGYRSRHRRRTPNADIRALPPSPRFASYLSGWNRTWSGDIQTLLSDHGRGH